MWKQFNSTIKTGAAYVVGGSSSGSGTTASCWNESWPKLGCLKWLNPGECGLTLTLPLFTEKASVRHHQRSVRGVSLAPPPPATPSSTLLTLFFKPFDTFNTNYASFFFFFLLSPSIGFQVVLGEPWELCPADCWCDQFLHHREGSVNRAHTPAPAVTKCASGSR